MEGLVSDNKIHESKELGLLSFEVTVTWLFLCSSGVFKKGRYFPGGHLLSGLNTEVKKFTLLSWSRYFRSRAPLLSEFYGIYSHHCDLYTNREEDWLADHCQSPHRQSNGISPQVGKKEHQLHKITNITMSLTLQHILLRWFLNWVIEIII